MNIERSSVGEAESSAGLRFFGSACSDQRKTPGWVHGCVPEAEPPGPETFVQPPSATAANSTARNAVILMLMRAPVLHRAAQALPQDRCRAARKNHRRRLEQSPTV